jgi:glutamate dehydrogenase/leucine dehydrogenase
VEGSNIPMSFSVEKLCHKKGITVVPDFVANAGGVISSYVEYIGGSQEQVFEMVQGKVVRNTKAVLEESLSSNRMPRKAALNLAMDRVRDKSLFAPL